MDLRRKGTRPRPRRPAANPAIRRDLAERILEAVPAGICQIELDGAISFANSVAIEFLGLGYDDLSKLYVADFNGKTFYEGGRECPVSEYPVSKCLATGQPQPPSILGVRRPDGRVNWGIFSALPVHDHGKLFGAVVTFIEITQRKQAEEALRESEERYRQLVEFCPDGILIHAGGRIVFANKACAELFGAREPGELLDTPVIDLVHAESRAIVAERIQHINKGAAGQPWMEQKLLRRDGSSLQAEAAAQAVFLKGQRSIQVMIRDVTQRKRADAERDQLFAQVETARQRLELLSRRLVDVQEAERRQMARDLHDEIGQELTALKLNLDRCVVASAEPSVLQEAQARVDQLVKLVREMSLDLRPTMLDDLGLLPALHWHFDRFFKTSGIRVNFKHTGLASRRFTPEIETAAYRVVQEALTNVVRHSKAVEVTVRLWTSRNMLSVQIEDLGAGFEPEKALAAGASSGLSGMRERAALLGGQFRIESTPGSGTHLTAEFPITSPVKKGDDHGDK